MRVLLGRLLACLTVALARTWRVRVGGALPPGAVLRLWHGDLLALAGTARRRGVRPTVLVSRSADGEWASVAARALGFDVVRGSTSRGATAALRALVRRARAGAPVALAADGPRGPARVEAPGALGLARLAGAPLVRVEVRASPAVRLPTWDRHVVPLPFARVAVALEAA